MPRTEAKVYVVADARQAMRAFKELSKSGSSTGSTLKSALGGGLAVVGTAATAAVVGVAAATAGIVALGFSSLKAAADMEQQEMAFRTLLGSAKEADKFLRKLEKFAATTPFQFEELTGLSKKMLALGWTANDIIPDLTALGDAVSALGGTAEVLDRVIIAIGQMRMKGKVSAEEMMQLTEANINAWGYLAEAMGVTVSKARELAEQGKIGADFATKAIIQGLDLDQRFHGMMRKQAGTLLGLWSNLIDLWQQLKVAAGQAILPIVKKYLKQLVDWVSENMPKIKRWFRDAGQTLRRWATEYIPLVIQWIKEAARQAKKWWRENKDDVMKVVTAVGRLIEKLGSAASWVLEHEEAISAALNYMWAPIKDAIGHISTLISYLQRAYDLIKKVTGARGNMSPGGGGGGGGGKVGAGHSGAIATGPHSGYPFILHGTEAVVPLEHPDEAQKVMAKAGLSGGVNVVNVYLDGKLVETQVTKRQQQRLRRLARGYV